MALDSISYSCLSKTITDKHSNDGGKTYAHKTVVHLYKVPNMIEIIFIPVFFVRQQCVKYCRRHRLIALELGTTRHHTRSSIAQLSQNILILTSHHSSGMIQPDLTLGIFRVAIKAKFVPAAESECIGVIARRVVANAA